MPPFVSTGPSVPPENARIFTAQAVLFMINVRIIRKKQEKIWWNKIKAVPLHSLIRNDVATLQGVLTERLGNGLQNRVERFDSARHLNKGSLSTNFLFCLYKPRLESFFIETTCFLSFFSNFATTITEDNMDIINKYFPNLTDRQKEQIAQLDALYREWNAKINVISRKDIDNLYEHHVLHSMAIAKAINFKDRTEILDFGCGGGFPGIPLAILFPECRFKLIDGTGKKIRVCNEVAEAIGLKNLKAEHLRGEEEKGKYDFVVSRAVMQLPDLMKIIKKNFKKTQQNALPNGLLCLKGGNLNEELKSYSRVAEITPLSTFFDEEWFTQDKQLVYVPC